MERSVIVAEGESERPSSSPFEVSPKGRVVVTPPWPLATVLLLLRSCLSNASPRGVGDPGGATRRHYWRSRTAAVVAPRAAGAASTFAATAASPSGSPQSCETAISLASRSSQRDAAGDFLLADVLLDVGAHVWGRPRPRLLGAHWACFEQGQAQTRRPSAHVRKTQPTFSEVLHLASFGELDAKRISPSRRHAPSCVELARAVTTNLISRSEAAGKPPNTALSLATHISLSSLSLTLSSYDSLFVVCRALSLTPGATSSIADRLLPSFHLPISSSYHLLSTVLLSTIISIVTKANVHAMIIHIVRLACLCVREARASSHTALRRIRRRLYIRLYIINL